MKNLRMSLSALAVFAIVGSALAFTGKSPANIYCFSTSNPPVENLSCASQSGGTLTNFVEVGSGGSTTTPCSVIGGNPYISSATCDPTPSGQQFKTE